MFSPNPSDSASVMNVFRKEGRIGDIDEYPEDDAEPGFPPEEPGELRRVDDEEDPPPPVEEVDPCREMVEFVSSVRDEREEDVPPGPSGPPPPPEREDDEVEEEAWSK